MIASSDISVVVQGIIDPVATPQCLRAIRKHLPHATIILSTWAGSAVSGLDYDELILCCDPGGVPSTNLEGTVVYNNTNRQIISTQQGLKKVTTRYVLKLRSDITLHDTQFLNYWDTFPARDRRYTLFKHRILNYYLFTPQFSICNGKKFPVLFHPSDWMFFGLTEDVEFLFSIPLQPEPTYSLWWTQYDKPPQQLDFWPAGVARYIPEQYLFYSAVMKKFSSISFQNYLDVTREKENFSRRMIINNFLILDYRQWHISLSKYQHIIGTLPYGQTSHAQWQEDYKTYCDSSYSLPWKQRLFRVLHVIKPKKIELEKKFFRLFFKGIYRRYIYLKYGNFPIKLKQKLSALEPESTHYIYVEDNPKTNAAANKIPPSGQF